MDKKGFEIKSSKFIENLKMKSYGNQTISDNSLLDIDNGLILYPIAGNLILFDCNICKEIKRIFISFSIIKVIKKIPLMNNYLISCENGHIYILDMDFKILYNYKPKQVNNVYSLDISTQLKYSNDKIYQYICICHNSVSKEDDDYYLVDIKNALSLIEMEIDIKNNILKDIKFRKIFTKQLANNFSIFNYTEKKDINNLELISFHWNDKKKINIITIYNINEKNIIDNILNEEEKEINEMNNEIIRYKKLYFSNNDLLKIVFSCKKRNIFIFNLKTLSIDDSFQLEGVGDPGEFYVDDKNLEILMINKTAQLLYINISEKINNKQIPLNKKENNLCEVLLNDDFIRCMNWGLIRVKCKNNEKKVIIVNAYGIKIYKYQNKLIEEYYSPPILTMSGCGACSLTNDIYVYGDLLGHLIIFNKTKEIYEKVDLKDEMIRAICSDKSNKIIYIGTLSGKIFLYDYNNKLLNTLQNNNNDNIDNKETITCLRFLYPNLYFSDTGGHIYIYNTNDKHIIYNYLAHKPQKDNTNIEFGSLSIKSEVWSFLVHEINNEYCYIVTGSEDQKIRIWKIKINSEKNNIKDNKLIKEIKEHKYAVTCLDWTSIKYNNMLKEVLLSCSDDKTINIFDSFEEKFNLILKVDFSKCIRGFFTLTYCSFNICEELNDENKNLLCIGTQAGYLIIYDIYTKNIKFMEKIHYGGIEGLFFENNKISTCGNDNIINIIEF